MVLKVYINDYMITSGSPLQRVRKNDKGRENNDIYLHVNKQTNDLTGKGNRISLEPNRAVQPSSLPLRSL